MSDIDMQAGNATEVLTESFRAAPDFSQFPMGENQLLIYSPQTDRALVVPAFVAQLFRECQTFASLDEHATLVCQKLKLDSTQQETVKEELNNLVKAGMMVSHRSLLDFCKQHSPPDHAPDGPLITSLRVPTRDRPQALARCLTSYAECARKFAKNISFVAVDTSNTEDMQAANRQVMQEIKESFGVAAYYAGFNEHKIFAERLAKASGLPAEVINFALMNGEDCPISVGASRNLLLLDGIDELLAQVDDDSICHLMPTPGQSTELTFTSKSEPRDLWLLLDDCENDFACEDFFSLHERFLGRSLGSCLDQFAGRPLPNLDQTASNFWRRMEQRSGRVAVSSLGLAGDSGMGASAYFLWLDGQTRNRLIATEQQYKQAVTTHRVVRAVTNPTINAGPACQGFNLALDNREMLPPFFPVQRCEDEIFGLIVNSCLTGCYFAYQPWALSHKPQDERTRAREKLWTNAASVSCGELLMLLVSSLNTAPQKADPGQNMEKLGGLLVQWGAASPEDFEEMLRLLLWRVGQRQIMALEELLQKHRAKPDSWAFDVQSRIIWLREALPKKEYPVPSDLRPVFGEEGARLLLQRLVLRYGELLKVWPEIRQAASQLLQKEHRLGQLL